jgi:hypothetical protein
LNESYLRKHVLNGRNAISEENYDEAIKILSEAIKIDLKESELFKEAEVLLKISKANNDLAEGITAIKEKNMMKL